MMSKTKKLTLLAAVLAIIAILIVCGVTDGAAKTVKCPDCAGSGIVEDADCETCGGDGQVRGSCWALMPPLIAIGLALITKEVYSSLFIGIVVGAIFASDFSFAGTLDGVIGDGMIAAISDSAGIFLFLVMLGILVALVNKAGGSAAFGRWAQKHIKSKFTPMAQNNTSLTIMMPTAIN